MPHPAERLDRRHTVAVLDHIDGEPGGWGQPLDSPSAAEVIAMLARLHRCPVAAPAQVPGDLDVAGRNAFTTVAGRWRCRELDERLDVVCSWPPISIGSPPASATTSHECVPTHGEPHPGNMVRTADGLRVVG